MFRCSACNNSVGPRVSPILLNNSLVNAEGLFIIGAERKFCPECAGEVRKPEPVIDLTHVIMGRKMLDKDSHIRNCKKNVTECHTCLRTMSTLGTISATDINQVLVENPAPKMRISLISIALDNMMDKTLMTSKRAGADVLAAIGVMKGYEERGGGL